MDFRIHAVNVLLFLFLLVLFDIRDVQGKLTCPDGWTMYEKEHKCIRMFQTRRTWEGARVSCQNQGGDLIVVNNNDKNNFLADWYKKNKAIAWIGVKRCYSWSRSFCWLGKRTMRLGFSNWFGGEPNNAGNNEDCVSLVGWVVSWNDFKCSEKIGYICETDAIHTPPAKCPPRWYLYGKNCFRLYHRPLNWYDARKRCQKQNGDLAIIPDEDTNNFLSQKVVVWDTSDIFIGATDSSKEGLFQWVDPSVPFSYQNWYVDQPNNYLDQDCAHLWGKWKPHWADGACTDTMHYMCQQKAITYPLICPAGWFQYSEYCFRLFDTPKSWTDARDFCRAQSKGRLATIPDRPTRDLITYAFVPKDDKTVWIGLNDLDKENVWTWVDSTDSSNYTNWGLHQPNNLKGNQDCVAIWPKFGQTWVDTECKNTYSFLCQTDGTRSPYACPPGWSLYGKNCFKLHQTLSNWSDARSICKAEQGYLATIPDKSTQYFLFNEFIRQDANHIWIGLNDLETEKVWKWADTSLTIKSYSNWEADQPNNYKNQDCGHVYGAKGGLWADGGCYEMFHFLCQKPAGKAGATLPPPTTPKSIRTKPPAIITPKGKPTARPTNPRGQVTAAPPAIITPKGKPTARPTYPRGQVTAAPQKSSDSSKKAGLSSGGVAGVVIAFLVVAAAAIAVGFLWVKKKRANANSTATGFDNATYDSGHGVSSFS